MKNEVTVTFPQSLLTASKEYPEQFRQRVLFQTLASLYVEGKISSGMAAKILGCDLWEFYRLLSKSGFSVIDYDEDDMDDEAKTSRELAAELRER